MWQSTDCPFCIGPKQIRFYQTISNLKEQYVNISISNSLIRGVCC